MAACHCISDKSESNIQITMNYQGNKHVSGAESRKIKKRKDGEDKVLSDGMSQWLKKPKKTETETIDCSQLTTVT